MSNTQRVPTHVLRPAQIRGDLDLSRERMARLMDVSAKTIERWEHGNTLPASVRLRSRLAALQSLIDLGASVYTSEGFHLFLHTPLPEFNGRTALQMIENDQIDQVLAALAADYEGLGF